MTAHPQSVPPAGRRSKQGAVALLRRGAPLVALITLSACFHFDQPEVRVIEDPVAQIDPFDTGDEDLQNADPPVPDRKPVLEVAGVVDRPEGIAPPEEERRNSSPSLVLALSGLKGGTKVESLLDKDFADVVALLGDPSSKQMQSPGEMWLFAASDCTLRLFFYPQVEGESFRVLSYEAVGAAGGYAAQECLDVLLVERRETEDGGEDGVGPTGGIQLMKRRDS